MFLPLIFQTKRRYEKYNGLNTSEGRVVEILGDTYGLGDSCQKFFERNGGLHSYDIESVNMSSTPQTITFCSAQGEFLVLNIISEVIMVKECFHQVCAFMFVDLLMILSSSAHQQSYCT